MKVEKFENIIVLDGAEYVNQKIAAESFGLSVFTFRKKVKIHQIPFIKLDSGTVLYKVTDLEQAAKKGWFRRWFM